MKEKMILIAICMTIIFCMSACSGNTMNSGENQNAVTEISTSEKDESADDEAIGDSTMIMMIDGTKVNVEWEDNQAVERLRDMAKDGDITIQMSMACHEMINRQQRVQVTLYFIRAIRW